MRRPVSAPRRRIAAAPGGSPWAARAREATAPGSPPRFDAGRRVGRARAASAAIGVSARHLESGRSYAHNGDAEFESASVIKIAVLTEAMAGVREGRVDLAERWDLTAENKADGSGMLLDARSGPESDLERPGDPDDRALGQHGHQRLDRAASASSAINARMQSLGFAHIRLFGTIPMLSQKDEEPSPWKGFRLGSHHAARRAALDDAAWRRESCSTRTPRSRSSSTSTRTPAACGSRGAFRPPISGPARPARCPACATTPGSSARRRAASSWSVFTDGSKAEGCGPGPPGRPRDRGPGAGRSWTPGAEDLPDIVEKPRSARARSDRLAADEPRFDGQDRPRHRRLARDRRGDREAPRVRGRARSSRRRARPTPSTRVVGGDRGGGRQGVRPRARPLRRRVDRGRGEVGARRARRDPRPRQQRRRHRGQPDPADGRARPGTASSRRT